MNTEALLFALLRIALGTQPEDTLPKEQITPAVLEQVYALSKKHDLAHLAGQALAKLGLLGKDEISDKFRKHTMVAVHRFMLLQNELLRLSAAFEKAQTPFIPLKGSVLREAYPESWMRTSGDIDIQIQKENLQTLHRVLTETLHYKEVGNWGPETTYVSPTGVTLELHYGILEEVDDPAAVAVLEQVWDLARPVTGCQFQLEMPDAFFYFHHMVHMAKHFLEGGCGIRTVMDIWVLQNRMEFDVQKRDEMLQEGNMLAFAKGMEKLAAAWFSQVPADADTQHLERYLLDGGIYGTLENKVKVQQGKQGGKIKYILSRIFVPYSIMKNIYPVLQKHRWLLPFMEVWRWIRAVFTGNISRQEMQSSMQTNSEEAMGAMLQRLGLKEKL